MVKKSDNSSDSVVETTMAEIAFVFVMAMFLLFAFNEYLRKSYSEKAMGKIEEAVTEMQGYIKEKYSCNCSVAVNSNRADGQFTIKMYNTLDEKNASRCQGDSTEKKIIMFHSKKFKILEDAKICLEKVLCPRIISLSWNIQEHLKDVLISGHTSSVWSNPEGDKCIDEHHCNVGLSNKRSLAVRALCRNTIDRTEAFAFLQKEHSEIADSTALASFFNKRFFSEGRGPHDLIYKQENGQKVEDKDASRRVEFKIQLLPQSALEVEEK